METYPRFLFPALKDALALARKLYFCDNGIAGILAKIGEGALFENAIHNQLRWSGELSYLTKGSEHEIDFILTRENHAEVALEVKYHPILSDNQKLKRLSARYGLAESWLVGRYPAPEFHEFIWGGLIF